MDDLLNRLVLRADRHRGVHLLPSKQRHIHQKVLPQLRPPVQVAVHKVLIILLQTLHALRVQPLLVKLYYLLKRSFISIKLHRLLVCNVLLVHHLLAGYPLPQWLELALADTRRLDELHVVDVYLLRDQVRLLQACVVVEVYVPVNHPKLTPRKSQLRSQHHALLWSQIHTLRLFQN